MKESKSAERRDVRHSYGNYSFKTIYNSEGNKEFLAKHKMKRNRHTHIAEEKGAKAAEMIILRAFQGEIPDRYPDWMIESINRLWFGQGYENRSDINNENLLTNDPAIRFKRKRKRGAKGYKNRTSIPRSNCR